MSATYRIEICPNNRAGCKDSVCKAEKIKIKKGELRFASWVEYKTPGGDTMASWAYKHWGCVSGAQIGTLRDICNDGDGEFEFGGIDGYDEMEDHPEIQEKVRRVIMQGHIDPEDFKGDPEKNKPGVKGIHLTAKQKEKRDNDAAAAATAGGSVVDTDDKKVEPKAKRGRKKAENDEDEEDQPQPKKTKTTKGVKGGRKSAGAKVKDESEDETVAPPAPKGRKAASKVKNESDDETLVPRAPKGRKAAKVKAEAADQADAPSAPKGRKAAVKVKAEVDADEPPAIPATKTSRRSSKVKKEESGDEEALPPPPEKKAKRGRKSAAKAPTPESEEAEPQPKVEEEDEKPAPKKGRRASKAADAGEARTIGRRRSARVTS